MSDQVTGVVPEPPPQPPRRVIPPPVVASRGEGSRVPDGVVRDVGVVIVAGGSGRRTGSEELKQFRWVSGKPALLHSVQAFMARPDVAVVVVVLPKAYAPLAVPVRRRSPARIGGRKRAP